MVNARRHFPSSEPQMKQRTRDNLIYVAVGLSIAAMLVGDFLYGMNHQTEMWRPSKFTLRAVYTTALLVYFVARETRKAKATLAQVLGCILFASIVHLGIVFTFRRPVGELSGISFSALAVFEMFLVFQLMMAVVRYLRSG